MGDTIADRRLESRHEIGCDDIEELVDTRYQVVALDRGYAGNLQKADPVRPYQPGAQGQ